MKRIGASFFLVFLTLLLLGDRRREATPMLPATQPTAPLPPLPQQPPTATENEALELLSSEPSGLRSLEGMDEDDPHIYTVDLKADDYLHLDVEQRGRVDLYVELIEPNMAIPIRFDRPGSLEAAEAVAFVARTEGTHKIEIRSWDKNPSGDYGLSLVTPPRPANDQDRLFDAASRVSSTAWRLREDAKTDKNLLEKAVVAHLDAAEQWAEIEDLEWQATLLFRAGRLDLARTRRFGLRFRSDLRRAEDSLRSAVELYGQAGNPGGQAVAYSDLGILHNRLEELNREREAFQSCVELSADIESYEPTQASCLQDLGHANRRLGRFQEARRNYRAVIDLRRHRGEACLEASARSDLGSTYFRLGNHRLAREEQERALRLAESSCLEDLPAIRTRLANALERLGEDGAALRYLDEALALRRDLGDRRGEAVTLMSRANILLKSDFREAERVYRQALALFLQHGSRRDRSTCLRALCTLYRRSEALQQAEDCHEEALATAREAGQIHDEAALLLGQARLAAGRGNLAAARALVEDALEIIELVREQSGPSPASAYYLSFKQEYYDFLVAVLAELHRQNPENGHAVRAFEMSERSRARGLLDSLSAEIDIPETVTDPERPERIGELEDEIARLHAERLTHVGSAESEQKSHLEAELRRRFAEIEEIARSVSRRFALARPQTLPLDEIMRDHLDEETLLLEYQLGPDRSFLWAVSRHGFRFHADLPSRHVIEKSVNTLRNRIRKNRANVSGHELTGMLLSPVADLLAKYPHLLIVPQGALHSAPFGFLPHPDHPDDPLVATHRLSFAPSVAVLAALRKAAPRGPPARAFVGVGDSVFDAEDATDRLGMEVEPPEDERVLGRLHFSRQEVETLHLLMGSGPDALAFYGFDANRSLYAEGVLEEARILHFATHGLVDKDYPELSTVVVSRYSAAGESVDGYLRAYEIARLDLAAELVVLSACETGLGTRIRGEGLIGLTQAFLQAGAPRVVASLWRVDDAETAHLMTHFYDALVKQSLAPAEALRQAQNQLRQQKRAPYYWAGFVLQGEWR